MKQTGTETLKNHGQYVKAMGGSKIAAQACAGMPLDRTQGSVDPAGHRNRMDDQGPALRRAFGR